jgi:glycosyltransferase involved in cell wall biosynthesis
MNEPRIALFACSYEEVDGVANTVRHFERYAAARACPFLLIHGGFRDEAIQSGTLRRLQFRRKSPKFALDQKHDFDLFFWRYYTKAEAAIRDFRPDLIHITGPSDVGLMGALLAHRLKIPLAASWHTNLHEYAERRAMPFLRALPERYRIIAGEQICKLSLKALGRFYRIPRLLFAPNYELVELLQRLTGKRCRVMSRGVDTDLFSPARRTRRSGPFTIGYVGRITVEKNVSLLANLEKQLLGAGITDFRFLIVGQGALEAWLRGKMEQADFAGVLHGINLAEAYANMDVFVFPSHTDTFGNVVLEAMASGVPAIATESGGPKFIVRHEETGFLTKNSQEFLRFVSFLLRHPERQRSMGRAARDYACGRTWDAVFDDLFSTYDRMLSVDYGGIRNDPKPRPRYSAAGASI